MALAVLLTLLWGASPALAFTLNPGDILVSNHSGNNVQRLDPTTGTVTTLTSVSATPVGLAFDTPGNLYINVSNGIDKLDRATDTLSTFFTGTGQREGLTFDPVTQHLFSVAYGANAIEEVDLSGHLVRTITIPGTSAPVGISSRNGTLMVTDNPSGKVFVGTTTGSSFTQIGSVSSGSGFGVDEDAAGNIYANDFGADKTVKFAAGTFTPSDFITGLGNPATGLSIADDGSLTIGEFSANAISVWNSNGTLRRRYTGVSSPDELVVYAPAREAPPEQAIAATGTTVTPTEGKGFTGAVASVTDPDTRATASEYTASIAWGDGSTSTGTVSGSAGHFTVNGTHTHREEGSFKVTVKITDADNANNTATATTSAKVADAALGAKAFARPEKCSSSRARPPC